MLDRITLGVVPRKHHIAFRDDAGRLLHEECFTRDGFSGPYSILYHRERPHAVHAAEVKHGWVVPKAETERPLAKRHFKTQDAPLGSGPSVNVRTPLLFNDDLVVSVLAPTEPDPVYFSNGDADDLYFVQHGEGVVRTMFGDLSYRQHDYIAIPRGTIHRILPTPGSTQRLLSIECLGGLHLPRQWRNEVGQLRMDAPFCHRDFTRPSFVGPIEENIRSLLVKKNGTFHAYSYDASPLDVVGWDGAVYPFIFPILNFQPRAGLVHLPPDWHGTFGARGALVCSFVPRTVDFHPEAIPCPYPHASVDCDEIIFYVRGNFTSRRGVGPGSISLHPAGIPHGPHPGAYEASIGAKTTDELAVMVDTYKPLVAVPLASSIEDRGYMESFIR